MFLRFILEIRTPGPSKLIFNNYVYSIKHREITRYIFDTNIIKISNIGLLSRITELVETDFWRMGKGVGGFLDKI